MDENKFIDNFRKLLQSDKYISKKTYDQFMDRDINYEDESIKNLINNGYTLIEKHNKIFLEKKMIEYKEYFDNMFKGIDDNIVLDIEQRKAILIDEDYSLIVAGAGSGKTTTMAAKVKYLVDKCHIEPQKIIVLAFSNKAVDELENRIKRDFKLNVDVLTFHSLGSRFIKQIANKKVNGVVTEYDARKIISNYVKKIIFPDKDLLKEVMEVFEGFLYFDSMVFNYKDFDEYYSNYIDKKYEQLKNNIDEYIIKVEQDKMGQLKTLNGEYVKSICEVKIANYLYKNGYNYKYEKVYPQRLENGGSYFPDFTVDINGKKIYIEYYGLTEYNVDGKYSFEKITEYRNIITKKQTLHNINKTELIDLYGNNYLTDLVPSVGVLEPNFL